MESLGGIMLAVAIGLSQVSAVDLHSFVFLSVTSQHVSNAHTRKHTDIGMLPGMPN